MQIFSSPKYRKETLQKVIDGLLKLQKNNNTKEIRDDLPGLIAILQQMEKDIAVK